MASVLYSRTAKNKRKQKRDSLLWPWLAHSVVSVPLVTYLLFLIGWRFEWLRSSARAWLMPMSWLEYTSLNYYLEHFTKSLGLPIDETLITLEINDEAVRYREEDRETVIPREDYGCCLSKSYPRESR